MPCILIVNVKIIIYESSNSKNVTEVYDLIDEPVKRKVLNKKTHP
jgi:hypothetical protein